MSNPITYVDRSQWKPGPWDGEPDALAWLSEGGTVGLVRRVTWSGHLCGYVGVDVPVTSIRLGQIIEAFDSDIHGGITWDGVYFENDELAGDSLSMPRKVRYWIGFDCVHSFDVVPSGAIESSNPLAAYRTFDYVRRGVERMQAAVDALLKGGAT